MACIGCCECMPCLLPVFCIALHLPTLGLDRCAVAPLRIPFSFFLAPLLQSLPFVFMCSLLQLLMDMKLITTTRRTFDRALAALPITQHDRVWVLYLVREGNFGSRWACKQPPLDHCSTTWCMQPVLQICYGHEVRHLCSLQVASRCFHTKSTSRCVCAMPAWAHA